MTDFTYLGLSNMATREERTTSGNTEVDDYSYDAYGHRIALTHDPVSGATETFTYGYDTHGSTSLLLNESDAVEATYGYTPYGDEETSLSQGDLEGDDVINPYRYTGKRFDTGSGHHRHGRAPIRPGHLTVLATRLLRWRPVRPGLIC